MQRTMRKEIITINHHTIEYWDALVLRQNSANETQVLLSIHDVIHIKKKKKKKKKVY